MYHPVTPFLSQKVAITLRKMLNDYEWSAIGGPTKKLTHNTPFVTDTLKLVFEQESNLKFKKDEISGITYDGKNIRGWHIYGVALRNVDGEVVTPAAGDPTESTDAAGPSEAPAVSVAHKAKKRRRDEPNTVSQGKKTATLTAPPGSS